MQDVGQAWALYARGDFEGAEKLSRKLLLAAPDDAAVLCCHAMCNWELGVDAGRCIVDVQRAIALRPGDAWLHHNLGTLLASIGQLDAACDSYRRAIALKPDDTQAFYALTQNFKFSDETEEVAQMLAQYASGDLSQRQQEYVCFGLAKVYRDLGRHDRAIHFCIEGNWLAQRPYDTERPAADLEQLREMVAGNAFAHIAPGTAKRPVRPIFIVGMPRSGTTLVETILSCHPQVHAGGEMTHIGDVERALLNWSRDRNGYQGGAYGMLPDIPIDYFTRNAEAVLSRVGKMAAGKPFTAFTDKLPENSQRLGLISLLFPDARIIYMRRHPLDCCISNFFLHFQRGSGYAFSQRLLGERYRQVSETMELWRRGLKLPILDVSYEALVSNPEPMIRRIVDFAGLEWDDACLMPSLAKRSIGTANQWQVRQPINRSAIGRWRPYEEWVQPLIESLGGLEQIEADQREMARHAA